MQERRFSFALKLVTEFSVIVAGVLVALFADAWWSERDNRQFENELLSDMAEEFRVNVAILDEDLAWNDDLVEHIDKIIALSPDELALLPDKEASDLFEPFALLFASFDPAMGITRAFVNSGDLTAVKARPLRLALANWSGLLEEKTRYSRNTHGLVIEIAGVFAIAKSDGRWSRSERQEIVSRIQFLRSNTGLVIKNQNKLQNLAIEIVSLLESH